MVKTFSGHAHKHTHNHNMKVEPFHLCAYCEYKALHKASLWRRIRCIHEGKTFPCHQCEYIATQKVNLKIHLLIEHGGEKTFPCHQCEYIGL